MRDAVIVERVIQSGLGRHEAGRESVLMPKSLRKRAFLPHMGIERRRNLEANGTAVGNLGSGALPPLDLQIPNVAQRRDG